MPKKSTPYVFDTARYNWKIDTLPVYLMDVWGNDTNTIYFLSSFCLLKYNGANYQRIYFPSGLVAGSFDGIDEQNIYVACSGNYKSVLLKYDGFLFNEISIEDSSKNYHFWPVYAYSINEIWVGTSEGRLIMYDGDSVHYYCTDTTYEVIPLLKKSENEFYVFADNGLYVMRHGGGDLTVKIFNFNHGDWQVIYSHVYKYQGNEDEITVHRFNNEILGLNTSGLYRFSSNEFVKILNINQFMPIFHIAGYSEQDFLIDGVIDDQSFWLLNWNGTKWSKEKYLIGIGGFNSIRKIQDKYIVILDHDVLWYPNIIYGTRK